MLLHNGKAPMVACARDHQGSKGVPATQLQQHLLQHLHILPGTMLQEVGDRLQSLFGEITLELSKVFPVDAA